MNDSFIIKLVDILNFYNNLGLVADCDFYKMVIDAFTSFYGIGDYINEVIFINDDTIDKKEYKKYTSGFASLFGQAAYEEATGNIIIYEKNIAYFKYMEAKDHGIEDLTSFTNIDIMVTLLHELEHALQHKRIKLNNSFEGELLNALTSKDSETISSYDYSLAERLAFIKSTKTIMDVLPLLNKCDDSIVSYYDFEYKNLLLKGYEFRDEDGKITSTLQGDFIGPTEYYALIRNCDVKRVFELLEKVPYDDRFLYGVSIPYSEYMKYKDEIGIKL